MWTPEEIEAYEAEVARLGHFEVMKRMTRNAMTILLTFCRTRPSPAKISSDGTIASSMKMFSDFISVFQLTAEVAKLEFEEGAEPMYKPKPECPLCFEILPPNLDTSVYMPCCGQTICRACYCRGTDIMNLSKPDSFTQSMFPGVLELKLKKLTCAFCRAGNMMPVTNMARDLKMERLEKQAARDDPRANFELGDLYMYGHEPTHEDMDESADCKPPRKNIDLAKAATYFKRAAELGLADGHYQMALCHARNYDAKEYWKSLSKASSLGQLEACKDLARIAAYKGRHDVAIKYWIVVALAGSTGSKDALQKLTAGYKDGHMKKNDLENALRGSKSNREEYASTLRAQYSLFFVSGDFSGDDIRGCKPSDQFL